MSLSIHSIVSTYQTGLHLTLHLKIMAFNFWYGCLFIFYHLFWKQVTNLEEQLEQFREELENKNEEVQQLHMQLEIQRKESTTHLQELEQENKLFKVIV